MPLRVMFFHAMPRRNMLLARSTAQRCAAMRRFLRCYAPRRAAADVAAAAMPRYARRAARAMRQQCRQRERAAMSAVQSAFMLAMLRWRHVELC